MKRRLIIAVLILLSVAALVVNSRTVCAFGFCESCGQQCRNESFSHYNQCRENGGSVAYCDGEQEEYNRSCQSVFCPGCPYLPL